MLNYTLVLESLKEQQSKNNGEVKLPFSSLRATSTKVLAFNRCTTDIIHFETLNNNEIILKGYCKCLTTMVIYGVM